MFRTVSLISFTGQILLSILYYSISYYNFSKYFEEHPDATRCGTGLAAAIFGLGFLLVILLAVIIIQYFVKIWMEKRNKLSGI